MWLPVFLVAVIAGVTGIPRLRRRLSTLPAGVGGGIAIAIVRLPLFWAAAIGLHYYWDWRQVAGYLALTLTYPIEMFLVRSWRDEFWVWFALMSALVAATSFALGLAFGAAGRPTKTHAAP